MAAANTFRQRPRPIPRRLISSASARGLATEPESSAPSWPGIYRARGARVRTGGPGRRPGSWRTTHSATRARRAGVVGDDSSSTAAAARHRRGIHRWRPSPVCWSSPHPRASDAQVGRQLPRAAPRCWSGLARAPRRRLGGSGAVTVTFWGAVAMGCTRGGPPVRRRRLRSPPDNFGHSGTVAVPFPVRVPHRSNPRGEEHAMTTPVSVMKRIASPTTRRRRCARPARPASRS
jgi:hypothetical protein